MASKKWLQGYGYLEIVEEGVAVFSNHLNGIDLKV